MKRNFLTASLTMLFCVLASVWLNSCSSDKADRLLSTIPADSPLVATMNAQKIFENAGCKVSGSGIEVPAELSKNMDKEVLGMMESIDLTAVAVFLDKGNPVVTGIVTDEAAFIQNMEKQGGEVTKEEGFTLGKDFILKDGQFWMMTSPSVETVKGYLALEGDKSIASSKLASELADMAHAVNAVGNLDALLDLGSMFDRNFRSNVTTFRMALAACFDNVSYVVGKIDLDGKKLESEFSPYNSDCKPSKLQIDMGTVSKATVKSLNCDGVGFFAVALKQEVVNKIIDLMGTMSGANGASFSALRYLDGTVAAVYGSNDAYKVAIEVKEKPEEVASSVNMFQSFIPLTCSVEGNKVIVNISGTPAGPLSASKASGEFDDAIFGVVYDLNGVEAGKSFDLKGNLMVEKDGKGIKFSSEMEAPENFLSYCLKMSR